jgi:hypothetical protein
LGMWSPWFLFEFEVVTTFWTSVLFCFSTIMCFWWNCGNAYFNDFFLLLGTTFAAKFEY